MNIQQVISGVGASAGPGFCIFSGKPYLAWKGEGSDQHIYWSSASHLALNDNGQYSWAGQSQVAGIGTSDGPALASFGGNLYMAWKGEGNDTALYVSKFDGKTWAPQQKLAVGSSNAPALVATSKYLLLAWKGEGSDVGIWYCTSTDGKTWTSQQEIGDAGGTSSTPALTASGDDVYMAWKAEPGDNRLFWSKYSSGAWSKQQLITSGTSVGPAIICDNNNVIWLAWQAVTGGGIFYCKLLNEAKNDWSPQVRRYGVGTSDRPAMISTGGGDAGIVMTWKGAGSDPGLYYGPLILPVPSSLTFQLPRQNIGQGSSTSMAIQAQLVMNQNGACTFSGTFFSEDSFPEGSESWYIGMAIKDGDGHAYSFSTNGDTSETDTSNWNLSATNISVAQNWAGIVINNPNLIGSTTASQPYWKAGDTSDIGTFFANLVGDIGTALKDVFKVIGEGIEDAGEGFAEAFEDPSGE